MSDSIPQPRGATWLSIDLVTLVGQLGGFAAEDAGGFHFDVVIVGSGYGGGMALQALAGYGKEGRPLRIAMLERGKEYLPGAFPSRMAELPGHVRFSVKGKPEVRGRETGLFDLRAGPDMGVVLANGLGGGSLINAGVMAEPLPEVFAGKDWPEEIRNDGSFCGLLDAVKRQIGVTTSIPSPKERTQAMESLAPSLPAEVTMAAQDDASRGIRACSRCGDCATGCNFGAKLSVDVGPIAQAVRTHDGERLRIVTGATVHTFARHDAGWSLSVQSTEPTVRRREPQPHAILTRHLILAAGTLGSTELLMRASRGGLALCTRHLGQHFSGNGDHIVMVHDTPDQTFLFADEATPFDQRKLAPTITRSIDLRRTPTSMVIQDLGIPGALRRLAEEVGALGKTMESLTEFDARRHRKGQSSEPGPEALSATRADRSLVMTVIVHDAAEGKLVLERDGDVGSLGVDWPAARLDPALDTLHETVGALAARPYPDAPLLASPLWRPLPPAVEGLVGKMRGPLVTTHPLGGCRMAKSAEGGVVNHLGQVFRGNEGKAVYDNLVVLDGAIVPTSLGINPSLTIAALAQRAACRLRDEVWGFRHVEARPRALGPRPVFRKMPNEQPVVPTKFQITERMVADAKRDKDGKACRVAIELWSKDFMLDDVVREGSLRELEIDPARSSIRVYELPIALPKDDVPIGLGAPDRRIDDGDELLALPLSGTMRLFAHEPSSGIPRALRAGGAWLLNRGLRDIWQRLENPGPPTDASVLEMIRRGWNLASRAGDRRAIEYELTIGAPTPAGTGTMDASGLPGQGIGLRKTLAYEYAANPTVQLMHAEVEKFPAFPGLRVDRKFSVDLTYFGSMGVPLLRIHEQQDHARALIDTASLLAHVGRTLLPLHAWTFRLPDRPTNDLPENPRLPGRIPGVQAPIVIPIPVGDGAHARLTYYRRVPGADPKPRPVLMIHGYSASGTTFAHEALPRGGLAGALCRRGHDVWVLDLRSSSGLPTGNQAWSFEQMGCQDIPAAIDHVFRHYEGRHQVDVVAHCMGAAMLTLGLLGEWGADFPDFRDERDAMPKRIENIVFSQVGPVLVMSPANTARAYAAQWLRHFLGATSFAFRPSNPPDPAEDLLDRLLCAVPYPPGDFRRENPLLPWKKTPWVAQRHRMDAFFGITFDLEGVTKAVLERIDEFFGPMHLDTVAQTIWFARSRLVTDRNGEALVVRPARVQKIAHCRVLALHAERNGLVDVRTRNPLLTMLSQGGVQGTSVFLESMGHQDSLIGRNAPGVYGRIADFLG